MRTKLASAIQSGSVRDVLTLAGGRLGAAAISFTSAPFIARLFDPADYGVAALFIAIATPAAIVLPLAYQNAIVIPKENEHAQSLLQLAVLAATVLFGVVCILLTTAYLLGIPVPFEKRLGLWIWGIPLAMLTLSLSLICEGWLTRTRGFMSSAKATFLQAMITSGGRLLAGITGGTSISGLIVPYLSGLFLRMMLLIQATWKRWHSEKQDSPAQNLKTTSFKTIAREYREFPAYNLPAGFLRTLSENLPILFFAPLFGVAAAGFYAMADRLIKAPLGMGAMSIRRVYMQRASAILHSGGNLKQSYHKACTYLALLALPPLLLLMLMGEPLMKFVLGQRWTQAGVFVEILAPWLYLMLISRPATALVVLLRRQTLWLRIQITSALLRALAMLLAWKFGANEEWLLWGFVFGGAPPYIWLMFHINQLLTNDDMII